MDQTRSAGIGLAVASAAYAALDLLFVLGTMLSETGPEIPGLAFLAASLLPAGFGIWLARAVMTWDGRVNMTLLVLGVGSAMFGLLGSLVLTYAYLGASWGLVGFSPLPVLFTLAPTILLGGVAVWLVDVGTRDDAPSAQETQP